MNIPFIDIADRNVWLIYIMPFSSEERGDYDLVNTVQQYCIENNVFGMGWDVDIPEFSKDTYMTDENISIYISEYDGKVSDRALNNYKTIKYGDFVITRNKNGHYYVGHVSSEGAFYIHDKNDEVFRCFSWGCKVDGWVDFPNEREVPSEIVGRFSQRNHSTIQRIVGYRQRMLVRSMYFSAVPHAEHEVIKLKITETNFIRSLDYKELEDLVSIYISERHRKEGYFLLPSSCKINQQNVEFYYVSSGRKPITCQVKNQEDIDINRYINETSFEKIYIFSGKWSNLEVGKKREQYADYSHIYVISPGELYKTLKGCTFFSNPYYDFSGKTIETDEINLDGYIRKDKPNGEYEYSIDDDFICFAKGDGLFYSKEFCALIRSYHIYPKSERKKEQSIAFRIMDDINRKK